MVVVTKRRRGCDADLLAENQAREAREQTRKQRLLQPEPTPSSSSSSSSSSSIHNAREHVDEDELVPEEEKGGGVADVHDEDHDEEAEESAGESGGNETTPKHYLKGVQELYPYLCLLE